MYELIARNHFHSVEFEEYYLERELAEQMFGIACKCCDCEYAILLHAGTGEVLMDYSGITHEITVF